MRKSASILGGTKKNNPAIRTYSDASAWLHEHANIERMLPLRVSADLIKLDRMRELVKLLDHPQTAFKSVHIAGTKGKGSTCEMTGAMLEACGYGVGLYTSPHLVDLRERVRVNRRMISEADFVRVAERVANASARLESEDGGALGECTFFELLTAMALVYFADQAVDVAVIEVGLGGRLDSTNVIQPEVAAITSISRDHWQILGDSLELIAREKAGIFKPGAAALSVQQKPEVIEVLRQEAGRVGAVLEVVGGEIEFSMRFESGTLLSQQTPHMRVGLSTSRNTYEHVQVPMRGEHQAHNCGLALAIIDKLTGRGIKAPEAKVLKGLATAVVPGRMEVVNASPPVLLDGAHNAESMKCLMKAIGAEVKCESLLVVFGCAADKDIGGMLAELVQGADKVIFTKTTGSARAADPKELARTFMDKYDRPSQTTETLGEALSLASKGRSRGDLICVTGSLHLVGEAKKLLTTRGA